MFRISDLNMKYLPAKMSVIKLLHRLLKSHYYKELHYVQSLHPKTNTDTKLFALNTHA